MLKSAIILAWKFTHALLEPTNLGLYDMFKSDWMILEVFGGLISVDWIWAREYHIGSQIVHLSDVLYLNDWAILVEISAIP